MEKSRLDRAAAIVSFVMVLAMLVGACGTDDPQGDNGAPETPNDDGQAQPDDVPGVDMENKVVTVGAWRLASGPYAAQNETTQAVEAYLQMMNDRGGINGWTFEFTASDVGGDPTRALEETQRLVENDEVFLLLWGPGSPANQPVIPYLRDHPEVPYHPGMSGDPFKEETYENIYPTIPPYSDMALTMTQYAIDEIGAERIALVYQDDAIGQDTHEAMEPYVSEQGVELVADIPYAGADTDFTPVARSLVQSDPDVVIHWGTPGPLVQTKAAAVEQGLDVPWFGPYYAADDAVVGLDPEVMDGTYFNYYLTPPFQDDDEHVREYKDALNEYFPENSAGGLALNGWASALVFGEAFEIITRDDAVPTREAYMEALETFDNRQIGVIPAVTYTADNRQGPTQSYIVRWEGGDWEIVGGPFDHPT